MKKNGFTLIELIATIAILSMIITIVVVKVNKNINETKDFGNKIQIETIESAALIYAEEYINTLTNIDEKKVDTVSLETLINIGLLKEKDIKDIPKTNVVVIVEINDNIKVKYTETSKNVIFINGPTDMSIYIGDTYKEMGAFVAIPGSGVMEITSTNISSNVNNNIVGEYEVTYSYKNTDSVKRKVSVITE